MNIVDPTQGMSVENILLELAVEDAGLPSQLRFSMYPDGSVRQSTSNYDEDSHWSSRDDALQHIRNLQDAGTYKQHVYERKGTLPGQYDYVYGRDVEPDLTQKLRSFINTDADTDFYNPRDIPSDVVKRLAAIPMDNSNYRDYGNQIAKARRRRTDIEGYIPFTRSSTAGATAINRRANVRRMFAKKAPIDHTDTTDYRMPPYMSFDYLDPKHIAHRKRLKEKFSPDGGSSPDDIRF
jgi:hypothetical protein